MTTFNLCQNKSEWDDYILDNGGHPLQLWGWGDVKSEHGWSAYRLFARGEEQQIIGAAQILIKNLPWPFKSLAYIPRGPIATDIKAGDLLDNLSIFVKKNYHSVSLTVEPDMTEIELSKAWVKSDNKILPKDTIILDLNLSESELLSKMAKKTRQYIRKSASEAIEIRKISKRAEVLECLDIYEETAKRAKFKLHKKQYYIDIFEKMRDNSPIFAAYQDGKIISFLWLAISTETVYELYGGMNEIGQNLRANYALKWYAIRKCKEWGISRYDFGGLIDGGVSTFKINWSDHTNELAGTFDKPLSPFYKIWSTWLPKIKKIIRKIK